VNYHRQDGPWISCLVRAEVLGKSLGLGLFGKTGSVPPGPGNLWVYKRSYPVITMRWRFGTPGAEVFFVEMSAGVQEIFEVECATHASKGGPMLVGVVSAQIRWEKDLLSQLDWAARNGFHAVELSCWSKQHEVLGLWAHRWRMDSHFLVALRSSLHNFERVDIHASYNTAYDPVYVTYHPLCREIYIDEIRWAMELAATIGAQVVTCHSGWLVHGKNSDQRERALSEALVRLDELASQYSVTVGMETIECFLPLDRCSLLERLSLKKVGLTLDIGHIHRSSPPALPVHMFSSPAYSAFGRPENFIRAFSRYIYHIHIHDCDGHDKSHLPLGKGIVDFPAMIQTLREIGYSGVLSIEIEGTPEETISAKDYLEGMLTTQR